MSTEASPSAVGPEMGRDVLKEPLSGGPAKSRKAELTRERLLTAFADLVGDEGLPEMEEVARRAGIGRSTLYRYFSSREEMLDALEQEALTTGARLVEVYLVPAIRGDPGATIPAGISAVLHAAVRMPSRHRQLMRTAPQAADPIIAGFQDFADALIADALIVEAQRRGEIVPHLPVEGVRTALLSMIFGLLQAIDRGTLDDVGALATIDGYVASLQPAGA